MEKQEKLMMVELPNLIHRILHLNTTLQKDILEENIKTIKKITNAECESALSYLEKLEIT